MSDEKTLTQGELITRMLKTKKKQVKIKPALLLMHLKSGLNARQIAKLYDVSDRTVYGWIQRHGLDVPSIKAYQANKGDLLSVAASRVLESIDDSKIANANLRDSATAFNILNNAERLEQGKATSHIEIHQLNKSIDDLQAMEDKLLEEIKQLKGKVGV
jgi:hypothetical protein